MNTNLTQTELENIRGIVGEHGMIIKKLNTYAENCADPELKTILQNDAQAAQQAQQQLLQFLN